jgi:hypothetical protein
MKILLLFMVTGALCAQIPGAQPEWVNDPYAAYPRDRYMAAVGVGSNRVQAEQRALAALAGFFGQSIRSDYSAVTAYTEALSRGIITVAKTTGIRDDVAATISMDTLVGAENGPIWNDGWGTFYAAAYMEREKAAAAYLEMIRDNLRNINALTSMTAAEKNTFDGHARYNLAAVIAGINSSYAKVINLLTGEGPPPSLNLKTPGDYTLEAQNIIKNITVSVNVTGDKTNRVRDAFAKVISDQGLRTRGNNPPYTLDVSVDMSEAVFPGSMVKYCRIVLSANLVEKTTRAVLVPFSLNDRVGHSTYSEAQARVLLTVEKEIAEKYPAALERYLADLLPRKR